MKRIVLAYSGGLVSSAAIAWLAQEHDADVVTVTLDFGQERELAAVRERALALGATRAHVIDVREEFVRDFVLPTLQAGVLEAFDSPELSARSGQNRPAPGHPMVIALARPLIARRLVEMAKMESASAVAHGGAAGSAGERALHAAIRSLDPSLSVIAPAREWGTSKDVLPPDSYRTDATLWGRILTSLDGQALPEDAYTLTRSADDCEGEGAVVDIDFESGVPVRANGVEMSLMEMIESLETIAGAHGVGRVQTSSYVVEAPAAFVLHAAHCELESLVIGADLARMKRELARVYASAAVDGRWFSDLREGLAAFTRVVQPRVTGAVRVRLAGGRCEVTERTSANGIRASAEIQADPKVVA